MTILRYRLIMSLLYKIKILKSYTYKLKQKDTLIAAYNRLYFCKDLLFTTLNN